MKKKALILGSGGLRIGQAGEFDYSGSQAIKALKEEGIRIVLVNPNIATVQTDSSMADKVYLEPLNLQTVKQIIAKEKPDFILLGFGGQTALNLGLELEEKGVLKRHRVRVLGTSVHSIRAAEDRAEFKKRLDAAGIHTAKSYCVSSTEEALEAAEKLGYPLMMRSGFALGGLGAGVVETQAQLKIRVREALAGSPHVLIEEDLTGWKEIEYEVMRDKKGNRISICNMENFDPMGIHTGESIVVAPSQTLTNCEYHLLRKVALDIAELFEVIGECNVQFALHPSGEAYRVIEMNPRLSRSSALASKATGYPIAFVATKLALGFLLSDIKNTVTKKTSAFYEPALDYLAVKIPRWDTHKLREADRRIGSEMKSVGEVMALGRSFPEALQKAVRMLNIGVCGLSDYPQVIADREREIAQATDRRLFAIYACLLSGTSPEEIHALSKIDLWFLYHLQTIAKMEQCLKQEDLKKHLLQAKKLGFSDKTLASFKQLKEADIRKIRLECGIKPVVKQIDTLAGEFDAETNYLYLTYHGTDHDLNPAAVPPVAIIGSGPYSIGSSVEFDWCAVNTARTLRALKQTAIIINSNPETVSTDYDESDRLYFEELTLERVSDIIDFEKPRGVIVSVGGQIANNLAIPLHRSGYPLLGTHPSKIDHAENRKTFSSLLNKLNIDQPRWESVTDFESAKSFAKDVGYPILIRPSYVLSGAAMNIVFNEEQMKKYLSEASVISPDHPVVMSEFISDAKELEVDGVARKGEIVIEAISEHIENAGVHSGDATVVLPPQRLYLETIRRTKNVTRAIVKALNITGPFNIQFIAKNNDIKVIECNVRASRSFPFVSKVTHHNFIDIATKVLLGKWKQKAYQTLELDYVGVKTPQFSYNRLKGANPVAHVEMASTGEVACLGHDLYEAFFKSWLATGQMIKSQQMLVSIGGSKKEKLLPFLKILEERGWELFATEGTHDYLSKFGVASVFLHKASERLSPNVASAIRKRRFGLIINIPRSLSSSNHSTDGFKIRRLAIDHHIPLITNLQLASTFLHCLTLFDPDKLVPKAWKAYVEKR